jgi:hypothetical protein
VTTSVERTGVAIGGDFDQFLASHNQTRVGVVSDPALEGVIRRFDDISAGFVRSHRIFVNDPLCQSGIIGFLQLGQEVELFSDSVTLVIDEAGLRSGAAFWSYSPVLCTDTGPEWLSLPGSTHLAGTADLVAAVGSVSRRLDLPLRLVLTAAGIPKSSFYNWRDSHGVRPRLASHGRLWELVQFVEDLEMLLTVPVPQWMLAEPARKTRFEQGEFAALLESARRPSTVRAEELTHLTGFAVGGDVDDGSHDDETDVSQTPALGSARRRISSRPARTSRTDQAS